MKPFDVAGGQFRLNGEPALIQAGEFHYFRTPRAEWRRQLGLLQAAGFNAVAAYMPWLWHQLDEDLSDFDGHSHPMRDLAGFLDLAAEMGLLIIARPGPYIMAETIHEGIPQWVFRKYPQVAFIDQHSKVHNIVSYLHPDFLACVRKWYQAIFSVLSPRQITRGGKIVLVQLDNEMGMMHWVRNVMDTHPDTVARFAAHLQQAYGDSLPARYPAGDLAEFLREGLLQPREDCAAMIVEDYRRFFRDYLREYAFYLQSEAIANGLEVPPVINIHGFANGGKTFPIGISQLVDVMALKDIVSATDVYPGFIGEGNFHELLLVNEMTKAVHHPEQPLFSIEFQAGGNNDFSGRQASLYDLHTRLCVSSGMRAINHYLFFDGENDPLLSPVKRHDWGHPVRKDGSLRRHYARYPRLSGALRAYGTDLALARPKTVTTIGFLLDHFMTEVNNAFTEQSTKVLTHQREMLLFDFIGRGLALTHRPFDAIELSRGALDVAAVPTLWVMLERQCDAAVQQKLIDYARAGGRLILAGRMCVEDFLHRPCTLLQEALGITQIDGGGAFQPDMLRAFGHDDIPASFVEAYQGPFDEVFATRGDGGVTGFIRSLGAGQVMHLGAALGTYTLDDLDILHRMADRMDCRPLFELSDWADVRLSQGDHGSFLFVNNYQDDPVETTLSSGGAPLLGGHTLSLPARRGAILPLEWHLRPGVVIHYLTAEVVEIAEQNGHITLKTDPAEFHAEVSLSGYHCDDALIVQRTGEQRLQLHGRDGVLRVTGDGVTG